MIKLVLSDVDGTLIPLGQGTVTQRTLAAIKAVQDAGVRFGLATGRDVPELLGQFRGQAWPFDTGILSNGKKIMVDGELARLTLLSNESLSRLAELAREYPQTFVNVYPLEVEPADLVYCIGATEEEIAPWKGTFGFNGVAIPKVPDTQIIGATIACNRDQQTLDDFLKRAREVCPCFDYAQPAPQWCDVLPKGLNKGTALPMLLDALGLSHDEVMMFGDADNDVAILLSVEHSVVVAGATPAASAAARWHIGPAEDDSVAQALEQIAKEK